MPDKKVISQKDQKKVVLGKVTFHGGKLGVSSGRLPQFPSQDAEGLYERLSHWY